MGREHWTPMMVLIQDLYDTQLAAQRTRSLAAAATRRKEKYAEQAQGSHRPLGGRVGEAGGEMGPVGEVAQAVDCLPTRRIGPV